MLKKVNKIIKKTVLLSHFISEDTPLYGGDKNIKIIPHKSIKNGDSCNTLFLAFPNHISTHVDLPFHFFENGKKVSDFSSEKWFFNKVFLLTLDSISPSEIIGISQLNKKLSSEEDFELLLIKTGFENFRDKEIYWKESPGLHPELATFLKDRYPSLRGIGIDFISISSLSNRELGRKSHRAFLEKEIILIEDMRLSPIVSSPDTVILAPLFIENADGAPVTVFGVYYK